MSFWIRLNMFFRSFFLQAGWNFVKYQNLGFAFVMVPFLRKLYMYDPEMLPTVLSRYLDTFNTHPVMASFCFGAMAKQEESVAKAQSVTEYKEQVAEWSGARRGLSITAASIGDRLFWGTLKPLTLLMALFIWMLLGINFFETPQLQPISCFEAFSAGIMAFLTYNAIALFVRWEGIKIGYESDESSCFGLTRFDWNRTIYKAKRLGIFFSVGLILFGVYHHFGKIQVGLDFFARALLVLFFIIISFVTRRLKIPNVYLYLSAVVIFTTVCLF
ncbi:MAG: PTS system mannose/fructose/sorbose family transporter subunit IID [Elusimicrobiaceae bacterium]|nr:PTS system mannose/fructose/sorbose family transporter subunit IID [Elusimicrobiaceae bacterium]